MYEYIGFLHTWSQIVLHCAFVDACVLLIYLQVGVGGGVILPVVTEYTILFTFVRSLCL